MKKIYFLLLLLFPAVSMCEAFDYPDLNAYVGVDAHIGRVGVRRLESESVVAVDPLAPVAPPPYGAPNHKVYTHITFNVGLMLNDYIGLEAGKSFSESEFHKKGSAKSRINFVYFGPILEYRIHEIKGLSLLGTAAIANFDARFNGIRVNKSALRLSVGGKYMFNETFGMRVGAIFHQTSKLKTKAHAASNGVHYLVGVVCPL